jgi:Arc/MetJ-type ribon-helix-helix transcriptional regulator
MASHNDYQLALRIPSDLLAAIDAEVERVKLERPGARVQRSDVVREALIRAFFRHADKGSTIVKREREDENVARPSHGNGSNGNGGNGNGRQPHASAHGDDDSLKSH